MQRMTMKVRWMLIIASLLNFLLGVSLILFFVFICTDGMLNSFSYFGVLSAFAEVLGVISLLCLIFGLILLKSGTSLLRLSRSSPRTYRKNQITLITLLILYGGLIFISSFCVFESFNDISSVGQAFNSSNIGFIAIGLLSISFIAMILVLTDMIIFKHDLSHGLITLTPINKQLLLTAPQAKLPHFVDSPELYEELNIKLKRLDSLKTQNVIDDTEYKAMKQAIIESYFEQ